MSPALRKLIGLLFVLTALSGLILNGYGLWKIWQWKEPLTQSIQNTIRLLSEMVTTSSEMLVLVEDTVETATSELTYLNESLITMADFLQDADPLLNSIQDLTGESLPQTLDATQDSLETAQQSADIIDTVLRAISSIPFFPGDPYNPEIPLSESLKRIGDNLSSIKPSLVTIQDNIESTQENLTFLDEKINQIVATSNQARVNLVEAQRIISHYQSQVTTAQEGLAKAQNDAPDLVNRFTWLLSFTIVWLALAQLGLLLQGLNLLLDGKSEDTQNSSQD